MKSIHYAGHDCAALENQSLRLIVTHSIGPRILWFGFKEGHNLFAELPDFTTKNLAGEVFHFHGGHRLWHAPEDLRRTYLPDDSPVQITPLNNGLLVTQNTEPESGIQKSIEIHMEKDSPRVEIIHRLTNHSLWEVTCAPWAITQFKTGGTAILPQSQADTGLLPNRSLALWAYTNPADPRLTIGQNYILVKAEMDSPFKVGFPNPRGWLAYWSKGVLFVKRAKYEAQSTYYDMGSSSECYCNDQFLELETLAPITTLQPNETISHIERWELYENISQPASEKDAQALVETFNLDAAA